MAGVAPCHSFSSPSSCAGMWTNIGEGLLRRGTTNYGNSIGAQDKMTKQWNRLQGTRVDFSKSIHDLFQTFNITCCGQGYVLAVI